MQKLYSSMTAAVERVNGQQHVPATLYPGERPGVHFAGGWVGPMCGLDRCRKSHPHQDSILDRPARSQSLYRLSYPAHHVIGPNFTLHENTVKPHKSFYLKKITDTVTIY